jgi:O-antigen/teichoic acid export membrane protein
MTKNRFAFKTSLLALLRVANAGLNLLVLIVLARALGSTGVGVYAYLVILLTVLLIPLTSGAHTLVLKLTAEATANDKWGDVRGALQASAACAVACACLLGIALASGLSVAGWLPEIAGTELFVILTLILVFDGLSAIRSGFLRGLDRPLLAQLPELLFRPAVLLACFGALVASSGDSVEIVAALHALVAASLAAFAVGLWIACRHLPGELLSSRAKYRRTWISGSASFASKGGIAVVNNYVDILLLGALLASSADVGIYRVAAQIAVVGGIVYVSINALVSQTFAVNLAKRDMNAVSHAARQSARLAFLASLPLPIIMLVFGEPLISLVFGAEFAAAAPIAVILLVGQMINSGFGTAASLLTVSDRGWTVTRWFAYGTLANVAACCVLIPVWGMMGAATANVAAGLLFNLAIWTVARTELGIDTSILGRDSVRGESEA